MATARAVFIVAVCLLLCVGCKPVGELVPEQPATLHVGDLAAVRVPSSAGYSVGSAGDSLTLVKRAQQRSSTVFVYRAVTAGHQTVVLTPRESGPDGCVSCVTLHYFVSVVN